MTDMLILIAGAIVVYSLFYGLSVISRDVNRAKRPPTHPPGVKKDLD